MSFLPLIFIVAIFYFLVFMPMQRQKKQQAQMLSSLQTGNDVLTTGGIVGTIVSLTGHTDSAGEAGQYQTTSDAQRGVETREPKTSDLRKRNKQ